MLLYPVWNQKKVEFHLVDINFTDILEIISADKLVPSYQQWNFFLSVYFYIGVSRTDVTDDPISYILYICFLVHNAENGLCA